MNYIIAQEINKGVDHWNGRDHVLEYSNDEMLELFTGDELKAMAAGNVITKDVPTCFGKTQRMRFANLRALGKKALQDAA